MFSPLYSTQLNEEICEFAGAFIGDGYMGIYGDSKNNYTIGITGDKTLDKHYFENYLVPLIKRNFPFTNPKIYYRNDEHTILLRIYSKQLYDFMLELGFNCGKKSRTVILPPRIIHYPKFMNCVIRGIFDTDGCLFFDKRKNYNKPYPRITLQSSSIELINQLESYLSNNFTLYVNKSNRNGYRNYLEIYGFSQLETFLKQIGFSNKRHLDKLKMLL
ncbi:MAG TPA: LAGLIDADG family homing endonuclease [Candidatus Nanoarchaeia archaeon]|nr:LAGLIDADG family homing endonuclease [Candidatus Nanoarchaeia archaeon]